MEASPEVLLISAMIQSGESFYPAQQGIKPSHFYTFGAEYEWITAYHERYAESPSKIAFKTAFPDFRLLTTTELDFGIDAVKKNSARQATISLIKEASEYLKADEPFDALNLINAQSRRITNDSGIQTKTFELVEDWSDVYEDVVERVDKAKETGLTGVATGIPTLDERTSGAQNGDLWIIAARLGQGKTWSLTQMAEGALMAGKKVLFVSLEQTWRQIAHRVHTILGNRLGYRIRHTSLSSGVGVDLEEYKSFLAHLPQEVPGKLVITDGGRGRITPITLASFIEEHQPDVVYVDYITLMSTTDNKAAVEDWRAAASISADVKAIAMSYNIPIIAAAQINRLGEGGEKPPSVAKLSQTDALGQDASIVVTMRRASNHTAQYSLEKNRHGESGVVFWTIFKPDEGEFKEVSYQKALDQIIDDESHGE